MRSRRSEKSQKRPFTPQSSMRVFRIATARCVLPTPTGPTKRRPRSRIFHSSTNLRAATLAFAWLASHAKASVAARKFVEEWKIRDRGLLFVGPVGVGKTHLAVAILKTLIEDCGVKGLFCDFSDLLERIQATFSRANTDN